jgi:hypothetical protein
VARFTIRGAILKDLATQQPLCYDLEGTDATVKLGGMEGTGNQWTFTLVRARGDTEYVTVQAAAGKRKGWYLDYTVEQPPAGSNEGQPRRRLVLVEKPEPQKQFAKYVIAP